MSAAGCLWYLAGVLSGSLALFLLVVALGVDAAARELGPQEPSP